MKGLVVAGNYGQFKDFIKGDREYIYVYDILQIYGHKDCTINYIGTYYEKFNGEQLDQIRFYCQTHNIIPHSQ